MTSLTLAERLGLPERGEPSEPPPPISSFPPLPGVGWLEGGRDTASTHTHTHTHKHTHRVYTHTHTHMNTHTRTGSAPRTSPPGQTQTRAPVPGHGQTAAEMSPPVSHGRVAPRTRSRSPPGPRARFGTETLRFGAIKHQNEIGGPEPDSSRGSAAFGPRSPGGTGSAPAVGPDRARLPAASRIPGFPGSSGRLRRCSPKSRERIPKHGMRRRGRSPFDPKAGLTSSASPQPHIPVGIVPRCGWGPLLDPPSPCNGNHALPCPPRAGPDPGEAAASPGSASSLLSPQPKAFPGQPRRPSPPWRAQELHSPLCSPARWHQSGAPKPSAPLRARALPAQQRVNLSRI